MDNQSRGVDFCEVLAIVFITLKLTGVIAWSWWWVTAPLWGGLAALIGGGMIVDGILGIISILSLIFACGWLLIKKIMKLQ